MNPDPYAQFSTPEYYCGDFAYRPGADGQGYRDFPINRVWAEYIASRRPRRVLDMGCGYGYLVARLRARGIDAWGMDISSVAMERAPAGVSPYLVRGNIARLPFGDGEFDLSVSFGVLEHLTEEDAESACREAARVSRAGIHAIGLSTEFSAVLPWDMMDRTHRTMKPFEWWRQRFPDSFEVWEGSEETWWPARRDFRLLVVAPCIMPIGNGYGGIERLAFLLTREMARRGIEVHLAAPTNSLVPHGVKHIDSGPATPGDFISGEALTFSRLRPMVQDYSVVLDMSHSKLIGRELPYHTRQVNPIWHAPTIMQPPLSPWNTTALSQWQARACFMFQGIKSRVVDMHCIDDRLVTRPGPPGSRFMVLGRINGRKGVLEAISLCQEMGAGLDIVGLPGEDPRYNDAVLAQCHDGVVHHGEPSFAAVMEILSQARALLYPLQEDEAHSHKSVDAMAAGTPVIVSDRSASHEYVEDGVTGFVVADRDGFLRAMRQVDGLDRDRIQRLALARWSPQATVDRLLPVLEEASRGARW